jgi:hypothetical protein
VSVQRGELGTFATVTMADGAGGTATLTHAQLMSGCTGQGLVFDGTEAPETFSGTPFDDSFFGGAGADTIDAGAGDEWAFGSPFKLIKKNHRLLTNMQISGKRIAT